MIPETLRHCPLFSALDEKQLAAATMGLRCHRLAAGETLFEQDAPAQDYFVVESGLMQLSRLTPEGDEKVIEMIGAGESFAEAVMFMNRSRYPVSARAVDDAVVWALPNRAFLELLRADNGLALRMLGQFSMRMHGLVQEIEALACYDATQRLIHYLLEEHAQAGAMPFVLRAPKQVIASRIGVTPETFSRILHRLRQEGLVGLDGARLCIREPARLRAFLQR